MKYKTVEVPKYGDVVRGLPNGTDSPKKVSGFVVAEHSGGIAIVFVKPGTIGETIRVYGEAENFELLARNDEQ